MKQKLLADRMKFTGIAQPLSDVIPLERKKYAKIKILFEHNVVDPTIAAGETWDGVIDEIKIEQGTTTHLECGTNELTLLSQVLGGPAAAGVFANDIPVTGVTQHGAVVFHGPFDFTQSEEEPILEVKLRRATDEWASATAFEATVFVVTTEYEGTEGDGIRGIQIYRRASPSQKNHEVAVPSNLFVNSMLLLTGGVDDMTRYRLGDIDFDVPAHAWQEFNDLIDTSLIGINKPSTSYYQPHVQSPPGGNRFLLVDFGGSQTLTAFLFGPRGV